MNKEQITWAAIIPLIGGLPLAAENIFKKPPEYAMAWSGFQYNDRHYINYMRTKRNWSGKYYVLDHVSESVIPNVTYEFDKLPYVDIVCGCPPCAGLSSLSVTSSADSAVNDHMLNAAKLVLSEVQPIIYMFENAPKLATMKGKPVADKLYVIAKEHGYSMLLYTTESRLHNNCQIRPRTFVFFCKKSMFGDCVPTFEHINSEFRTFEDFINKTVSSENDPMNECINKSKPSENPYYAYCYERVGAESHEDFVNKLCTENKSKNLIVKTLELGEYNFDNISAWFSEHGFDKIAERVLYMKSKTEIGKGFWTHGITVAKQQIPAFIGVMPTSLVHPYKDRYITYREGLTLMGMPDDFCLDSDKLSTVSNHICQNVPVKTAEHMFNQILLWMTTKPKYTKSDYTLIKHQQNDTEETRGFYFDDSSDIDELF